MFGILRIRWFLTLLPRTLMYLGDGRVPFIYKFIPFLIIPFMLTPLARLTFAVPWLGFLDGFTVFLLTAALFTWLSSRHVERKAGKGAGAEVVKNTIEGEYRVVEEKKNA